MKLKRISRLLILTFLIALLACANLVPTFANSAQTSFSGVNSTGLVMPDTESPIVVEKELLTFDINEFPSNYYPEEQSYLEYGAKVTAEYTFYNPSEYTVTSRLLFPFGNAPSYAVGYLDQATDEYKLFDDTTKYDIKVNGNAVEKKVRHTLFYYDGQFDLEKNLSLVTDGFIDDEFYKPDTPVTKYTFEVSGIDTEQYRAASVRTDMAKGDYRLYFPQMDGYHAHEDGTFNLSAFSRKTDNVLEFYLFGTPFTELPKWTAYENGSFEENTVIDGKVELVKTSSTTFKEFALSNREESSPVSESDWYNALVTELNESGKFYNSMVVSCGRFMGDFATNLMRWYEYEITFEPNARIVNTVTAPIYPEISTGYEPNIYNYTYLLSPAKTWKSFGEIEVVINTPYYMTANSIKEYQKTETGYALKLEGLPEAELLFTLSESENPVKKVSPYKWRGYLFIGLIIVGLAAFVVIGALVIVWIVRKKENAKR